MNLKNFLLSLFLIFITPTLFAQSKDGLVKDENGTYYYETVRTIPDTKKEVLFKALKGWIRKNVKSTDKVIYDDQDFSNINATASVATSNGTFTEFKLNIDIKDDKFKMSASSPMWYGYGKINPLGDFSGILVPGGQKKKIINTYEEALQNIADALENAAKKPNSDSW